MKIAVVEEMAYKSEVIYEHLSVFEVGILALLVVLFTSPALLFVAGFSGAFVGVFCGRQSAHGAWRDGKLLQISGTRAD